MSSRLRDQSVNIQSVGSFYTTVLLCPSPGAVRGEVDLLPPPSPAANWTSALPTLPSSDSSLVFSFNGSNHVAAVPDSVVSALSGDHFTLQLWMRRGGTNIQPATAQTRGNRKEEETIVCSTVKNGALYCAAVPLKGFKSTYSVFFESFFLKKYFHIRHSANPPSSFHLNPRSAVGKIKLFIALTTGTKVLLRDTL